MHQISIEIKIIFAIICFALLIVGFERYEISQTIQQQFIESKKSKNQLLINTIVPVINMDLSLGLMDSNKEYLDTIVKQNKDIKSIHIIDKNNQIIYKFPQDTNAQKAQEKNAMSSCKSPIIDNITQMKIGEIYLAFYNDDYEMIIAKNKEITIKIFLITFVLLILFILVVKREFQYLKKLTNAILHYDPKENNFNLDKSSRQDEVGVIHNAFIDMAGRINIYTTLLDDLNSSLEDKIQERTNELQMMNEKLQALSVQDALVLKEKNILLKELYHRVKNNLQIISSSLMLQSRRIKDKSVQVIFSEATQRIKAMAMVHEKLYQASDLELIDMQVYTEELILNLSQAYADLDFYFEVTCGSFKLDLEKALPIGLIINEIVANSIKYAFDQTSVNKHICVSMYNLDADKFILEISDNGKGADFQVIKQGFGFKLVESLAAYQLKGKIEIVNQDGLQYKFEFSQGNVV